MKVLNNYDELIIAIDSNDTKRFEGLLAYSDCRNDLVNRYIQNYGIENISKITETIEARALKNILENICEQCQNKDCKFGSNNSRSYSKTIYMDKDNVVLSQLQYNN